MTAVLSPEFTDADVTKLARLCCLELSPVDTDLGRQYLTTIVGLLARLQEVDVTNDCARPDQWSRWTAWDTAEAVRRGEVSALELTQAALARVAAVDNRVHAWLRLRCDMTITLADGTRRTVVDLASHDRTNCGDCASDLPETSDNADDYFLPESDLPPLRIDAARLARIRRELSRADHA